MDSHRRLSHINHPGKFLFLTWHLHGSLPIGLYPPPDKTNAGKAFVWMDRYLDTTTTGPMHLKTESIATLVEQSIHHCAGPLRYYDLEAYVIMANHVHLLVLPHVPPERFLQTIKGYTAREANRLLNRTGHPFWQSEVYDHWVRDDAERERIRAYIENNPVKADLVGRPEDFRWSSAHEKPR
jgi:putative transposase